MPFIIQIAFYYTLNAVRITNVHLYAISFMLILLSKKDGVINSVTTNCIRTIGKFIIIYTNTHSVYYIIKFSLSLNTQRLIFIGTNKNVFPLPTYPNISISTVMRLYLYKPTDS